MGVMHFLHAPLDARELRHPSRSAAIPFAFDEEGKTITNQEKLSHLKYGASDIGKTGCVPIAIYNALILKGALGENGSNAFLDIVERTKELKAPLMGGRMGTDPYMIYKILEGDNVGCLEITERDSLAQEMADAEIGTLFLITQWNDMRRPLKGIHAYVAEKRDGGRWALYNRVYRDYPTLAHNLSEMIGRGRLIVADRII